MKHRLHNNYPTASLPRHSKLITGTKTRCVLITNYKLALQLVGLNISYRSGRI